MKTKKRQDIRPLKADAGLYKHHVGLAPYQDENGTIRESYQALNAAGEAVACVDLDGGEIDRQHVARLPSPLHVIALTSWAAQLGEDIKRRDAEIRLKYLRAEIQAERISYGEISELQDLVPYIDPGDTLLLEWAGVPESEATGIVTASH